VTPTDGPPKEAWRDVVIYFSIDFLNAANRLPLLYPQEYDHSHGECSETREDVISGNGLMRGVNESVEKQLQQGIARKLVV